MDINRVKHHSRQAGMIKLRATYLLLMGVAVIIIIAGLQLRERLVVPEVSPPAPLVVDTVRVTPRPFIVTASYNGTVDAHRRATLASRLSSTVGARYVKEGDSVAPRQTLLKLDDTEQKQELLRLKAAAERIAADLDYWRGQLKIDKGLFAQGTISEQKLRETARQVTTLRASLEENAQAIATAETRLGYTEVVAPFAGVVQSVVVVEGEAVNPGGPLLELIDTTTLKAVMSAPQADQQRLVPGLPVDLRFHRMSTSQQGHIGHIYPALDSRSRNLTFEVSLDSSDELPLHVGMSVKAEVELERFEAAITLPLHAVQQRKGEEGVFTVKEGRAAWVPVKTGLTQDGEVQIVAGLNGDERVISTPYPSLREGALVQLSRQGEGGQPVLSGE